MSEQSTKAGGVTMADVLFIVFRRKRLILACALAGIAASIGYFFLSTRYLPIYASQARILVRYILDSSDVNPKGSEGTQLKTPDTRGESILANESDIITSFGVAMQVVTNLGAPLILGASTNSADEVEAAFFIQKHLTAEISKRGTVIGLTFNHKDPKVAQRVLQTLVKKYEGAHLEFHQMSSKQLDEMRDNVKRMSNSLWVVEQEFADKKKNLGIISLDESKKTYGELIAKTSEELYAAQADLAMYQPLTGGTSVSSENTPQAGATAGAQASREEVDAYIELVKSLRGYRSTLDNLRVGLTDENPRVKNLRARIDDSVHRKDEMEKLHPGFEALGKTALAESSDKEGKGGFDVSMIPRLGRKMTMLTTQLADLKQEAKKLDDAESGYRFIERRLDQYNNQYRFLVGQFEQAKMRSGLVLDDKTPNLSIVDAGTEGKYQLAKILKICGAILVAGVALGIGLAFLLEMVVDRTIKRPGEIERSLNLRLFLWIPELLSAHRNGASRLPNAKPALLAAANASGTAAPAPVGAPPGPNPPPVLADSPANTNGGVAVWDEAHEMRSYFEALRDRLVMHFEVNNLTHKPKLVAITSVSQGAGVTTLATGLAAALSETGDGNVLLVDMNMQSGVAHPFQHGKPSCNLNDALESERRDEALVKENFYRVSGNMSDDTLPRIIPKRFSHLMPRMKASDYDFIIFDMPPVTQTSITPRLASHMDITMLVLEAEKNPVDLVRQAVELLKNGKAEVGIVLNKKRDYAPAQLQEG